MDLAIGSQLDLSRDQANSIIFHQLDACAPILLSACLGQSRLHWTDSSIGGKERGLARRSAAGRVTDAVAPRHRRRRHTEEYKSSQQHWASCFLPPEIGGATLKWSIYGPLWDRGLVSNWAHFVHRCILLIGSLKDRKAVTKNFVPEAHRTAYQGLKFRKSVRS